MRAPAVGGLGHQRGRGVGRGSGRARVAGAVGEVGAHLPHLHLGDREARVGAEAEARGGVPRRDQLGAERRDHRPVVGAERERRHPEFDAGRGRALRDKLAHARVRRHTRLRKKIVGTESRPRLVVTRSSRHVFVQVIDDAKGLTLASASTMEADLRDFDGDKTAKARRVGELVAERAKSAGVEAVVFDRGGSKYAGRVAAIADGAREGGLTL